MNMVDACVPGTTQALDALVMQPNHASACAASGVPLWGYSFPRTRVYRGTHFPQGQHTSGLMRPTDGEHNMQVISEPQLEEAFEQLTDYLGDVELATWTPGPECYVRYQVVKRGHVIIGENWWMGRKEAYMGIWTALNAIRAYLKTQREENDV